MERLCFLMELKPGAEAEYQRRHDEIWPEMWDAVSAAGYTNYSLFRRGTTVVGYAECVPDVATVAAKMAASEVTPRWNESFTDLIQTHPETGGYAVTADEVWHLA